MASYSNDNIDDLLIDVKNLLEDGEEAEPQRERTLRQKLQTEREAAMLNDAHYDEIFRGAAASADRSVTRPFVPVQDADEPQEPPQPTIHAYNSDFADNRFRENFAPRRQEPPRRMRTDPAARRREPQYDGYDDGAEPPRRKKKRGRGCLTFLIVLILIAGLLFAGLWFFGRLRGNDGTRTRRSGVSTVLIAGTDDGGLRTDTLMLVTIDEKAKTYNVLSIPRDTLTNAPYSVPKINGAYGYYGCGEEGMAALIDLIEDCVGFRPDGYVLIDWNGFEELVDVMGGIDFEVPMDMDLDGVTLTAGMQHLGGREALTVARFRAGYSLADLQRVQVQRQLINAALDQWITIPNILKIPSAISCVQKNTLTDLNVLNILWLARDLKVCSAGVNETLPGSAQMIGDGSYYVLDPQAVADTINANFNPYEENITTDELYIKVG